jgi:hypothetical protein
MLSDKDGIQVVEVPAGVHVVEASFVNTAPRIAGTLLTAIGLLGVMGLAATDRMRNAGRATDVAAEQKPPPVSSLKQLAAVTSTLLIAITVVFWMSQERSGSPPAGSPPAGGAPQRTAGSVTQGSEATLHLDAAPSIFVSVNEQALNELMNALPARDDSKIEALVQSGQLIRVANDTGVRILETGGGKTKVRILQGGYSMAEGWVPERWLR